MYVMSPHLWDGVSAIFRISYLVLTSVLGTGTRHGDAVAWYGEAKSSRYAPAVSSRVRNDA